MQILLTLDAVKDFAIIEGGSALAEPITLKKGLTGAKPEAFCGWILDLLNAQPGDVVVDLFPGTGVMDRVANERTNVFLTPRRESCR